MSALRYAKSGFLGHIAGATIYYCKVGKKTLNAATGTALQCLHNKDRWLTFGEYLTDWQICVTT